MTHLSPEQLSALADDALGAAERAEAERHLSGCAVCREALAAQIAQDESLATALTHDPGEEYFETFAARVEDRLRAEGLSGAQRRVVESRGLADWFRSPRKLAWVGGIAALVAGAGIVLLTSREIRVPQLRNPEIEGRADQVAPEADAGKSAIEAPPATSSDRSGAVASRSLESGARDERPQAPENGARLKSLQAPATVAAPPAENQAEPSRMHEVRKNAQGEDVPVRSDKDQFAPAPAPVTEASAPRSGGGVRVAKPGVVQPMAAGALRESTEVSAKEELAKVTGGAQTSSGTSAPAAGFLSNTLTRQSQTDALSDKKLDATAFDALPAYPRSIARGAIRLTEVADRLKAATGYDAAAGEWTRLLGHVQGGPLEEETRWQIASTRFHAWQASANDTRARRASDAITAYLAIASDGPRRDEAAGWLGRVRK